MHNLTRIQSSTEIRAYRYYAHYCEMQNSNASAVPLLDFVSKCNVE